MSNGGDSNKDASGGRGGLVDTRGFAGRLANNFPVAAGQAVTAGKEPTLAQQFV
jgi:hypothetical protein